MSTRPVVVVTGASAGVGRATARAVAVPTDIADPEQVERAAERVEAELGAIDVWVNDAMVTVMSPVAETTAAEYRRVTEVTYLGAVHGTLAALRRMRPRDRGTIVQVGSALSYRAIPLQSAYCAAKHAMRGFTDSLRCELMHEKSGVRVTMVQMPALNTPQFEWSRIRFSPKPQPAPPIYQPEVAAEAVVFAAGAGRREVWVGGPNAFLMLANKLAPGVGDRYLARTGDDSQLTDEPADPDRRDNLDRPLAGDFGAHGRFDDRARPRSLQLLATRMRRPLALAAALLLAGAWLAFRALA